MLSLIIYGSRGMTSTIGNGQFACPRCSMMRHYNHRQVRLFFTLYFIPLIPLWRLGEYIECGSCGGTYGVEVLSLRIEQLQSISGPPQRDLPNLRLDDDDAPALPGPQASSRDLLVADARRSLVLFVAALGKATPEVMNAFRTAFKELVFEDITDQQVLQDYQLAKSVGATVENFVPSRLGSQSNDVKVILMMVATRIACADGVLRLEGSEALDKFGKALGLDANTAREIVQRRGK